MAEEPCRHCINWEEEIYWTHFRYTRFTQVLTAGFDQQIAVPEKFCKKVKNKLPETVTIKGPSGSTWKVGLTTNNNTVFFNHGWKEFVHDHLLQEKDLLVFKFNGDSQFDVLIFEGQSLCEKAASYFVRNCGHREHDSGCLSKRKVWESSAEAVLDPPPGFARVMPPEKSANNGIEAVPLEQSQGTFKRTRRDIELKKPFCVVQSVGIEEHFTSAEEIDTKPVIPSSSVSNEEPSTSDEEIGTRTDVEHTSISPIVAQNVARLPNRRLVTEQEKQNVVRLAQAALTNEGFMVVMKPTHIYRKFYMVIPSGWITKHVGSLERQDVMLRVEEKIWRTRFSYQKIRNSGGLSAGWKTFTVDNNLQEYDVCVFEPSSSMTNCMALDVKIFRVVR